jgi:C_GCAxxG_C_C family probable redox protein
MANKKDIAEKYLREGRNCSQAVLLAFSKDYNLTRDLASAIACGFGAGMGRMQGTCGAVTGAFMVIGLETGTWDLTQESLKEAAYQLVKSFDSQFKEKHKTTICSELLKCDLNTDEGKTCYKKNELKEKVCMKCVRNSVGILESILNKK